MQVLLKSDLLRVVLQLEQGQPAQVSCRPAGHAGVGYAVAQQHRLQPVARVALLTHGVLTHAHRVAHGFFDSTWHAHGGEVS